MSEEELLLMLIVHFVIFVVCIWLVMVGWKRSNAAKEDGRTFAMVVWRLLTIFAYGQIAWDALLVLAWIADF